MTTLQEACVKALDSLEQWAALIKHQYTGTSEGMTDLQLADNAGMMAIEALKSALAQQGEQQGWKPTDAAIAALKRFEETCSDGEGYDVPKDTMQCLQEIGLVYRMRGSVYCITDFGQHVLAAAPAPQQVERQGEQAKPAAYITDTEQGPMVWTTEMYDEACTYCDDGEFPVPLYTQPAQRPVTFE